MHAVGHGLAGAIAGASSTAIIHPISTVTLRCKLGYYGNGKIDYHELYQRPMLLLDGIFAQCLESFIYNGTNWGVYEFLKSRLLAGQEILPPITALFVGCMAADNKSNMLSFQSSCGANSG